ncbi:MAG: DUF5606 domain-containing protein [Flavobacteriales bacterium]
MDLTKIISISGKPGLFNLIKQSRSGFIVESIETGKKTSVASTNNVNLLVNIAMYTTKAEIPLVEVFHKIAEKEDLGPTLSHKESNSKLQEYFATILPDYDKDRVYHSDLKKLFQWYNILQKAGLVNLDQPEEIEEKNN